MKPYLVLVILLLVGATQAATITVCSSGCGYKSIQTAVYAAKPNDTIKLYSGTYDESVSLTKDINFIGNRSGSKEPFVTGSLYTNNYNFSLYGFSFNAVISTPTSNSLNNNSVFHWIAKGNELLSEAALTEALESYRNATILDPKNAYAWLCIGNTLNDLSRYTEAISAYDKTIEIDPNFATAFNNQGTTFYNLGKYDEAIQAYNKSLQLKSDAFVWNNLGKVLYKQGKYDDALIAYNKSLQLRSDASVWNNKGNALYGQGKCNDALMAYDKAIEINPLEPIFWQDKAGALTKLQRKTEASEAYVKASELGYKG